MAYEDDVRKDTHTKAADKAADNAAKEQKKAGEAAQAKLDESHKLVQEREKKALEDKQAADNAAIDAARKAKEEADKEAERRSKLSPEELAAEISPFAATVPHFAVMQEPHHSAEFILSEANGQRSRGNAYIADPATIYVGTPLKQTAPATTTQPPTYVVAAAGADCQALSLYAGGTIPGEGLRVAVLVRDAEINGNLINWGALAPAEQTIAVQTLAAAGIIVRL